MIVYTFQKIRGSKFAMLLLGCFFGISSCLLYSYHCNNAQKELSAKENIEHMNSLLALYDCCEKCAKDKESNRGMLNE